MRAVIINQINGNDNEKRVTASDSEAVFEITSGEIAIAKLLHHSHLVIRNDVLINFVRFLVIGSDSEAIFLNNNRLLRRSSSQ